MKATKRYTVSDGKMVLCLEPAEEGGYVVTSPLDPEPRMPPGHCGKRVPSCSASWRLPRRRSEPQS
jgi:hypothetical protein